MSEVHHYVRSSSLCQKFITMSVVLHSVSSSSLCQQFNTLSVVHHYFRSSSLCQNLITVSVVHHSVRSSSLCQQFITLSENYHSVKSSSHCRWFIILSEVHHSVSSSSLCQQLDHNVTRCCHVSSPGHYCCGKIGYLGEGRSFVVGGDKLMTPCLTLEWGQVADSFKLISQFSVTWATPCSCVRVKEKWERSWI